MLEKKLRPGDLLSVQDVSPAVLTKATKKYWYYYFDGALCRISKEKLWKHIDMQHVKVSYGSNMKRRRKQRNNRILDLHGLTLVEAEEKTRVFLNFVELPCKVITGKSEKMKKVVQNIVDEFMWSSHDESAHNPGTLIITEK